MAGQPYRFDFVLRNRGPLTSPVTFSVIPNSADTNLYLLTVDGPVPFSPELSAARADLSQPLSPGPELPFAVYVTSTNPTVSLNLFGGGLAFIRKPRRRRSRSICGRTRTGTGFPTRWKTPWDWIRCPAQMGRPDTDGDGYTAAAEFEEAGTASNDANSALRLRIVEGRWSWTPLSTRVYRLESRSDLGAGSWTLLREVRPDSDGVLTVGPLGSVRSRSITG